MPLLEYLKGLDPTARTAFATGCGTSIDYLFQVAYGNRRPKAALAVAIERESKGVVRCEKLLPEVDWGYVRNGAREAA